MVLGIEKKDNLAILEYIIKNLIIIYMSGNTRRRSSRRRSSRRRSSRRRSSRRRGGKVDTTCSKHIDKVFLEASATTVEQKITAINTHLSKCKHPADMHSWLRVKFLKRHTELLEQQQKEKEQKTASSPVGSAKAAASSAASTASIAAASAKKTLMGFRGKVFGGRKKRKSRRKRNSRKRNSRKRNSRKRNSKKRRKSRKRRR